VVTGDGIAGLARVLAVVDGGTGGRCRCPGWPTIVVSDADGRELARWTVHHQRSLGGLGDSDAELRDGAALTEWLVAHGLTGSRDAQLGLAREEAAFEARRVRWVAAAPAGLGSLAAAVTRREEDAEQRLADMVVRRLPGLTEQIRTLTAWAGVPAREHGLYCYESAPRGLLLTEPTEAILDALMVAPLSPVQLDGAADLFTCLEWTRPLRAEIPEPLRSQLIAHGTATGNRADALPNASRLRRRHHRLKRPANARVAADSGRCED
jgi:hypothetical protein